MRLRSGGGGSKNERKGALCTSLTTSPVFFFDLSKGFNKCKTGDPKWLCILKLLLKIHREGRVRIRSRLARIIVRLV